MSVKLTKAIENRELLVELHNIMELFRTIFADDKLVCRNIDENYEKILISDIRLIPCQYDREILQYVKTIKLVAVNINYTAILQGMADIDPDYKSMSLEFDSYKGAENILERLNIPKIDKLKVTNVMTKLRPLFSCVDKIFQMPFRVLTNITHLTSDKYNDIL